MMLEQAIRDIEAIRTLQLLLGKDIGLRFELLYDRMNIVYQHESKALMNTFAWRVVRHLAGAGNFMHTLHLEQSICQAVRSSVARNMTEVLQLDPERRGSAHPSQCFTYRGIHAKQRLMRSRPFTPRMPAALSIKVRPDPFNK